jgi:hypothetical protein
MLGYSTLIEIQAFSIRCQWQGATLFAVKCGTTKINLLRRFSLNKVRDVGRLLRRRQWADLLSQWPML